MLLFTVPLHLLQKTKAFQALLGSRFNHPKLYNLEYCQLVSRIAKKLDNQKVGG